jgi:hypothetical protein
MDKKLDPEVKKLRKERLILVRALLFYADPETYFAIGFFPDPPCGEFMRDFGKTDYGRKPGERARRTLEKMFGKGT